MQGLDLVWPIVGAVVAGGVIGAEREYRASPAGFRTHMLVALSSALLMLAAVHQMHWLTGAPDEVIRIDPVRMAHGILTGIGFLCGGVIFREGLTVKGLTTAASLWTTSAVGILFGVSFYSLAIGATIATLLVLAAADLSERFLPQRKYAHLKVRYRRTLGDGLARFKNDLATHKIDALAISQRMDGEVHQVSTVIESKNFTNMDALVSALQIDPDILGFDLDNR